MCSGSDKEKVLFVASYPVSGMLPFAAALVNEAVRSGKDVHAVTISSTGQSYPAYLTDSVHLTDMPYPETSGIGKALHKFFAWDLYARINQVMLDNGIRDVWFLTGEYGLGLWGFARALSHRYRTHYIVHDLEMHPDGGEPLKTRLFNRFFHRMTLRMARLCTGLVTCSKSQAAELKRRFPTKDVTFMPFPSLVTAQMASGLNTCPELDGMDGRYVLFFGRVAAYKGLDILCDAFRDMPDDVRLVIAGPGELSLPGLKGRPEILTINRFIDDSEVGSLFRKAAAVVYPYTQATMSGVLTIAHHFGTKVIASDLPFFADNVEGDDILFKAGDVHALSVAIKSVL